MRRACFALAFLFILAASLPALAEPLQFVIIQPGQPGTAQEAQPVMDALAKYMSEKTGKTVTGAYFNQAEPALEFLKTSAPAWGIVSLGFFMEQAEDLNLTPLASTRPGGQAKDVWRLVGPKGGPAKWKEMSGTIQGSMLFSRRAAACVLFDAPPDELPFALEGTASPLRALRQTLKGKCAAVVLDAPQYNAAKGLSSWDKLAVLMESPQLPTSPAVWFGAPGTDDTAKTVANALMGMKNDPEAKGLLELLRTDGFGPPDVALAERVLSRDGKGCR